jgi:hypothetical protein
MSDVQATAAPAATGGVSHSPAGADKVSSHSTSSTTQPADQGRVHSGGESAGGKSTGPDVGGPIKGSSTTGTPDLADKAAEAIEQGRELSQKDLKTPVTRIVNGQRVTKTLNEWINASQLEQASHYRFKEAQRLAQQAQQLIWIAQNNPAEFMRITGKDPNEFSQAQLASWLEEQQMSEEQKELRRLRSEKQQREETEKQRKAQEEQALKQKQDTDEYNAMVKESLAAWQESGLPDDPYFGQRMAAEIARHQAQGFPLTWKEAASIVKHDWISSTQRVLNNLPTEALVNQLGESILKKLREYEIARITSKQAAKSQSSNSRPGSNPPASKKQSPQFVNERDYNAYWNKLGYGG